MTQNSIQGYPQLEIRTIQELIGIFRIPTFQRGYRWQRRQVLQLLNDIADNEAKSAGQTPYYLQPIVLAPIPDQEQSVLNPELDKLRSEIMARKQGEPKEREAIDVASNLMFDVIDGQQRLTTLYLILKFFQYCEGISKIDPRDMPREDGQLLEDYMKFCTLGSELSRDPIFCNYELLYQTRGSQKFIQNIKNIKKDDVLITKTPDNLYIWHAYQIILDWARNTAPLRLNNLAAAMRKNVKVIWYELPTSVTTWKKFTDLNAGKIPLTNSELVKALIMRSPEEEITAEQKDVIIQQWDGIERDLKNEKLWGYLSHKDAKNYDTKIDLLFDIVAQKPKDNVNDYFTFDYFDRLYTLKDSPEGKDKWNDIYWKYRRILDWFDDRELYHKIGFLSLIDEKDVVFQTLIDYVTTKSEDTGVPPTNRQFRELLEKRIKEALTLPHDVKKIEDLLYRRPDDSSVDQSAIKKILTFYNVMYTLVNTSERYDFAAHKGVSGVWSLEHIHAQNSEEIQHKDQQLEWLKNHLDSLKRYRELLHGKSISQEKSDAVQQLIEDMSQYFASSPKEINNKDFGNLKSRFAETVTNFRDKKSNGSGYTHELGNMALLSTAENAAFNNSTFDVKRRKMIEDMVTVHIPICTKRVFLKTIPNCDDNHPFFWGEDDRNAYLQDIRNVLKDYLKLIETNDGEEETSEKPEDLNEEYNINDNSLKD